MTTTTVSRCRQCEAVINIHWPSCLVCLAILPLISESSVTTDPSQDIPARVEKPVAPIQSGWLVTYQDQSGKLCGGAVDKAHGTVHECHWEAGRWLIRLTDGQRVALWQIHGVTQTDSKGQLRVAWTVKKHGYDGNGPV